MAKYDAFGREIGEDTLEALRGSHPVEVEERPAPAPPRPVAPSRRRRRRRWGSLVVWLMIIGIGVPFWLMSPDAGVEEETPAPEPAPAARDAPPARSGSLLAPRRFEMALAELRDAGLGRPVFLRLEAKRLDAELKTPDGTMRLVQVSPSLDIRTIATTKNGAALEAIGFDQIEASAPRRLIRASGRGRRVNYLVLMSFDGRQQWNVYFTDGRHVIGDERGRPR